VFDRFRAAGLKLKLSKCALLQCAVKYLGHVVDQNRVATDPEKVRAVKGWAVPVDLPELRAFLGLVGYYRQYIPNFAGIAQLLNRLTAKGVRWQWTQAEQQTFDHLNDRLVEAPILAYPDPAKEYILDTDASNHNGRLCYRRSKMAARWWWLTIAKPCRRLRRTTVQPRENS